MLSLNVRLDGVVSILEASNIELRAQASETGFIAATPRLLADAVLELLEHMDVSNVSLDVGCGNGGWLLLAAAAGFPSHGIELDPRLLDHAQRNYDLAVTAGFIDVATPCVFIAGDMIPVRYSVVYDAFRHEHEEQARSMPIGAVVEDAYARLPVSIATADIIYCWSWPTQSRFVYNMLQAEAKEGVLFVLPSYERYTTGAFVKEVAGENLLWLTPLSIAKTVFVGRRTS
jgi:hypothetical protein